MIRRAIDGDYQIVTGVTERQIIERNTFAEQDSVLVGGVVDGVQSVPPIPKVHIIARAAVQGIVARPANQKVVPAVAVQDIVAAVSAKSVIGVAAA